MTNYTYLEIVKIDSKEVVKRIDVTGLSDSRITKIEMGMLMNLNHDLYYTQETQTETELTVF